MNRKKIKDLIDQNRKNLPGLEQHDNARCGSCDAGLYAQDIMDTRGRIVRVKWSCRACGGTYVTGRRQSDLFDREACPPLESEGSA